MTASDDLQLNRFNGSYVAGAHSIGADIISPISGLNGTVNDPSYVPFTTKETVEEAHKLGMKVLPWTLVSSMFSYTAHLAC